MVVGGPGMTKYSAIELCAGAGGQALGLEMAGFSHRALVEIDADCCRTCRLNRPNWNVIEADLRHVSVRNFEGVDLVAGGLPCPPFSVAGKQLGEKDERNLFEDALRLVREIQPKAVLIENVRGFLSKSFETYRAKLRNQFEDLGYTLEIHKINSSDFGVSQLRPRVVVLALRHDIWPFFNVPSPDESQAPSVGDLLRDLMAANGWKQAKAWSKRANEIAPTIVGGSKKHGGPDLGPTRARAAWQKLGVNGKSVAEAYLIFGERKVVVILRTVAGRGLFIGAGFILVGAIGLLRFNDPMTRLHAPTKVGTLLGRMPMI